MRREGRHLADLLGDHRFHLGTLPIHGQLFDQRMMREFASRPTRSLSTFDNPNNRPISINVEGGGVLKIGNLIEPRNANIYVSDAGSSMRVNESLVLGTRTVEYNVYANVRGVMTHLNTLFGPTDTVIPFGDGFLALQPPGPAPRLGDMDLDGDIDFDDINSFAEILNNRVNVQTQSIPEPSTYILSLIVVLFVAGRNTMQSHQKGETRQTLCGRVPDKADW